jgi:hypothetical protein
MTPSFLYFSLLECNDCWGLESWGPPEGVYYDETRGALQPLQSRTITARQFRPVKSG